MTTQCYVGGLPLSNGGALQVTGEPGTYPASAVNVGGVAVESAAGQVYVVPAGSPVGVQRPTSFWRGVGLTNKGALYITSDTATGVFSNNGGFRIRSDGALLVSVGGTVSTFVEGIGVTTTGAVVIEGDTPTFGVDFNDLGAGIVNTTASVGGVAATFTRATSAWTVLSDGTIGLVASGSARSYYSPSGAFQGYLAEGARTNLCQRGEDFSTVWTDVGTPTLSAGTTTNGALSLSTVGDDSAAALEGKIQTITFTGDAVKAISLYVKKGTSTSSVIRVRDTSAPADRLLAAITWSGTTPVVTMTTGTDLTGTPEQHGSSGIYRLSFATSSVTAANTNSLQIYPATDAALSVGNVGTIECGGVQAEDATFQSSLIRTPGSATVTRNADVLTYPFTTNTGTMFVQAGTYSGIASAANRAFFSLNDGTANEQVRQGVIATATAYEAITVVDGGVTQAQLQAGTLDAGLHKIAARFNTNDFIGAVDGTLTSADTSGSLPSPTTFAIGLTVSGTAPNFGFHRRVAFYTTLFTNAQLQAITS